MHNILIDRGNEYKKEIHICFVMIILQYNLSIINNAIWCKFRLNERDRYIYVGPVLGVTKETQIIITMNIR